MGMRLNIDTAQGVAGVDCIGYKIQNTNVNTNMNTKCKIQNTKYKNKYKIQNTKYKKYKIRNTEQ